MSHRATVIAAISDLMARRKMNPDDIGQAIGTNGACIRKWIRGVHGCPDPKVDRVLVALGFTEVQYCAALLKAAKHRVKPSRSRTEGSR